jgi:hypothetical protein
MKNEGSLVRGLTAFEVTRGCTCCVLPTLNIAVRVAFMARHVPSQAGNETSEPFDTLLYGCYLSIARWRRTVSCWSSLAARRARAIGHAILAGPNETPFVLVQCW